jgi:hypothetical protein
MFGGQMGRPNDPDLADCLLVHMQRREIADQAGESVDVALADRASARDNRLADLEILSWWISAMAPTSTPRVGSSKIMTIG